MLARILIVDDYTPSSDSLKLFLSRHNPDWQFFTASNEQEGIAIVEKQVGKREPIDLVLTDLVMASDDSGMIMLQAARKVDPSVMAILFTAKEKSLDRYAAYEYGAFDVVEKTLLGASANREINIKARAALRYREWSRQIAFMRRYFDPRVFESIEKNKNILALRQRRVTIVFWDIRGFSRLCEILKERPELIADFLRNYCEEAARTIFENNGLLDKFIGDGIMALFGVLKDHRDQGMADAIDAVRAGLAVRQRINCLIAESLKKWEFHTPQKIEIGLGCGIHTGDALVGNVGTDFRDQFTALGPHVNFSSRIESRAQPSQILISQSTQARVASQFNLTLVGEIDNVKNIDGKFNLYAVESEKAQTTPVRKRKARA